jgi:hypothetical protein
MVAETLGKNPIFILFQALSGRFPDDFLTLISGRFPATVNTPQHSPTVSDRIYSNLGKINIQE